MRVLFVVGSRRDGNSLKLAKLLKKELRQERIMGSIIVPGNQKIYVCTGCLDCDRTGVCDFSDDMHENIDKVLKSDVIIFITPTRWNLLSSDIKLFLDRLNPLAVLESLKGKKAIAIAIGSASREEYSVEGALTSIDSFCESSKMDLLLKYGFYDCLEADAILKERDRVDQMVYLVRRCLKR